MPAVVAAQANVVLILLVLVRFVLGMKPDELLDCLRFGEDADVFDWGEVEVFVFFTGRVRD